MSTFSQAYKTIHVRGEVGRFVKINIFSKHLTFWPDFYYFHGDFWHSKNVVVYCFFGRRRSQKVYGLYTHENVNIYGRPLS